MRPGWYVVCLRQGKAPLPLLGPYEGPEEAAERVDLGRALAIAHHDNHKRDEYDIEYVEDWPRQYPPRSAFGAL